MIPIEVTENPYGYPLVKWTQQVPREKRGTYETRRWLIGWLIGGVIIGAAIGWNNADVGVVVGAFTGAAFGGGIALWSVAPDPQNPAKEEWREKPVLMNCPARAEIEGVPPMLMFSWQFITPKAEAVGDSVPLGSFNAFELGTLNEWFAGAEDRKAFGDCCGLFIHAGGLGTKCVAVHGGPKADLSKLQEVLTQQFINNTPALLARLNAVPAPLSVNAPPADDDDIPKSL